MQQPSFTPDDGAGGDHQEHDQQVFADLFASGDIMRLDPTRSPTAREQQQQPPPPRQVPPLPPRRHSSPGRTAPPRRRVSPPESAQRRSEGPPLSGRGSRATNEEYEQEDASGYNNPLERSGRSSSDQRFDRYESENYHGQQSPHQYSRRTSNPNLSSGRSSSRQISDANRPSSGRYRSGGRFEHRTPIKKRSKSLGERMALAVAMPREPAGPSNLLLYHVSKPEPRARWVFNLSKHTNVVDSGPPPTTITSVIDKKRPNLGGLVWVNAVLGNLHCCLQKGVKNKAVTPVPADVLDGWLNGQAGWWWIGALKEGHRALWDSHVVMNWAMVFIPCSPEVAARNNMEVWHDKCLPGSLRVARPGELARKIVDIVTDDQDKEPEQVVHTHLCILLAEGDDLELKRPKMFSKSGANTPRASTGDAPVLRHSASMGNAVDLSAGSLERDGSSAARVRASSGDATPAAKGGGVDGGAGGDMAPFGSGGGRNMVELEEAMEKVAKYRERIVILKDDRRAKKALLDQLRCELQEKEEMFSAENDRLRLERNDIKDRAKSLWVDIENLRREIDDVTAEKNMLKQDSEGLKKQVDRLRRERNSARNDAMLWLEKQREATSPFLLTNGGSGGDGGGGGGNDKNADGNNGDPGVFPKTPGKSRGLGTRTQSAPGMASVGQEGGKVVSVDYKAAAAISKLKSKVDRLRRERDQAEAQAAEWLRTEQEKLANTTPQHPPALTSSSSRGEGSGDDSGSGGGAGGLSGGSPVVASLRAESLKLQRELQDAREEAKRLRKKAEAGGVLGTKNGTTVATDGDPHEARLALGRLLGQALNLLDPKAAADAKAAAAASAALSALNNGTSNGTSGEKSKQQHSEMEMEAVAPETPPEVVVDANGRRNSGGPSEVVTNGGTAFTGSNPTGAKFGVGPTLVGTTG